MGTAEVVAKYGAAWMEADVDRRRELLTEAWSEDGTYLDPTGSADGREALVKHIDGFRSTFPGHGMFITSGVDEHDGFLRFAWKMTDPDNNVILEGVDFGSLDTDGKIKSIVGFFGPMPEME
jgi:hypothetical protein